MTDPSPSEIERRLDDLEDEVGADEEEETKSLAQILSEPQNEEQSE